MEKANNEESYSQSQVQNIDGSINDLPPEILVEILKNLDAHSLFDCRLVNRQFNSISTEILCCSSSSSVELEFKADEEKLMLVKKGKDLKESRSLRDFTECMKQSENCPFVRFSLRLSVKSASELDHFLSEFDVSGIKCLKLSFPFRWEEGQGQGQNGSISLTNLTEKVGDLLVNKIPHLEEFGLELPVGTGDDQFKLFPNSSSSLIQLAHLKVVYFGFYMFSKHLEIVKELLTAAVNLEQICPFSHAPFNFRVSDFCYFHSLGKLGCVQQVYIFLSPDFISQMKETFRNLANLLKLSKLELRFSLDLQRAPQFWPDAGNFLSALFHSSKNTYINLEVEQLGFLYTTNFDSQFPRFTKLEKLSLYQNYAGRGHEEKHRIFHPGVKSLDIFPVVRDLKLDIKDWRVAFPEANCIPNLANVERIQLIDREEVSYRIEHLASICPNVKKLEISPRSARFDDLHLNFAQVVQTVSTHLPKLESLELFIDLDWQVNNSHALGSAFTGFSQENCQRLSVFDSTLKQEDFGSSSAHKILKPESELIPLIPEREHASIFDMKNLKELTINPYFEGNPVKLEDFMEKLTWISKKYTLDLMPQLKLKLTETEGGRIQ